MKPFDENVFWKNQYYFFSSKSKNVLFLNLVEGFAQNIIQNVDTFNRKMLYFNFSSVVKPTLCGVDEAI